MTRNYNKNYRSDIDGLRAIAILSVMLFHLNENFLNGGFVGVDIFFVISGFLITRILIKDLEKGNFSFSFFYIKRIRRIFPALFVVLLVSLVMANLTLAQEDFKWFAKTLKYASLQGSNILFSRQVGYFDPEFELMPLLHTWSLGVEEQFYLIWPVTLFLLSKFKNHKDFTFYGLIILSIISLSFSQYLINIDYKRIAFFSLPSRLWELGLGGILAFDKIKRPKNDKINELLGITGLILIGISIVTIKSDYFPGKMALLPCLGAALVIFTGDVKRATITANILSCNIFVFIGLISYSLYLWHWPLIIFYKEISGQVDLSIKESIALFFISILISYFSWKFIEIPFRKRKNLEDESMVKIKIGKRTNAGILNLYTPIITAIGCIYVFVFISKDMKNTGWQWRMSEINDTSLDAIHNIPSENCVNKMDNDNWVYSKCVIGDNKKEPDILLYGDSHAIHYAAPVISWAKKRKYTVLFMHSSGCPPIFDVKIKARPYCVDTHKSIIEEMEKYKNSIKYVFMAGRWSFYTNVNVPGFILIDSESSDDELSAKKTMDIFQSKLSKTLNKIGDKKVILLGEVPSAKHNKIISNAKIMNAGLLIYKIFPYRSSDNKYEISTRREHDLKVANFTNIMKDFSSERRNVTFFDPVDYLCDETSCFYKIKESKILYIDNNHLNVNGGAYLAKFFDF